MSQNIIPAMYSKTLGKILEEKGDLVRCVNGNYAGDLKEGDTAYAVTPGNITVRDYNGVPIPEEPDETDMEIVIDRYKYTSWKIPQKTQKQSHLDLTSIYAKRDSIAFDQARNQDILAQVVYADASNTFAQQALTKNNIYDILCDAYAMIGDNNALNQSERPFCVLNYKLINLLKKAPELTGTSALGDAVIKTGKVPDVCGFDIIISNHLVAAAGVYNIMFGTQDAITYAEQFKITEMEKKDFVTKYQTLYGYGLKTILPKALGKLPATIA
jgi:hypothetical protein